MSRDADSVLKNSIKSTKNLKIQEHFFIKVLHFGFYCDIIYTEVLERLRVGAKSTLIFSKEYFFGGVV